jgi:spore maturation protein CgeB
MKRLLFVASLHHPEVLQGERANHQGTMPLFPKSNPLRFWEETFRKRNYSLDIFYRNLPSRAAGDIRSLKSAKYSQTLSPQRIQQALMQRLPYKFNSELQQRNHKLKEEARRFQPEIIWMVGDNTVIHAETIAELKAEMGCKILYSTGVSPIVFSKPFEREAASLYDLVIVNDFYHGIQWLELGAKDMICLPVVAIDPSFHYPRALNPAYQADISFVGTLLPANLYSERVEALEALREFDLGIWTVHGLPDTLKAHLRGPALGESMLEVLSASQITINPHGNFMRYGGNMRLFEAAALGSFQLVDDRPGVHEWFKDGEHLITYQNPQDLREKAAYYLAHPEERQKIASAARAHVLAHHTYDQRLDKLENADFFRTTHSKQS